MVMERRIIMKLSVWTFFALVMVGAAVLCFGFADEAGATSAKEIDLKADAALERFYKEVGSGKSFVENSEGVLVFPSIVKAGFGIGGEYGEGALRIDGKTVEYYSNAAGSFGFQIGVQSKAVILVFLDKGALDRFRNSAGWEAGVDGSVALIKIGAGGSIDTTNVKDPIVAFVMSNKGLMYNLTIEGSKFTKIVR
jgi:lipid-binding SYLF domain-containing protein